MGHQQGSVTLEDLPALKKEYERAKADGSEMFKFNGSDLLTNYAKYLIEHMENIEKKHRK